MSLGKQELIAILLEYSFFSSAPLPDVYSSFTRERFQYPERCVIFLNLSFNLVSLGYLLRLVVGGEGVACTAAVEGEPSLLVTQVGDTS